MSWKTEVRMATLSLEVQHSILKNRKNLSAVADCKIESKRKEEITNTEC